MSTDKLVKGDLDKVGAHKKLIIEGGDLDQDHVIQMANGNSSRLGE